MDLLNEAVSLALGSQTVSRVYLGALQVFPAAWSPASLFGANDRGAAYDMTTHVGLAQTSAGTGAVAVGSPIGYASDRGPLARPALQATAANRPLWLGMPRTLGSELAPALSTWTAGSGWTVASGTATKVAGAASALSLPLPLLPGKTYMAFYTITRTAGAVTGQLSGGTAVAGPARNADGCYFDVLTAEAGNTAFEIAADATFAGTVRLVSVREVTAFANMGARFDGVNDFLQSAAVDMSNRDKATLIVSFQFGQAVAARVPAAFGNAPGNVAGSFEAIVNGPIGARMRGDTATGTVTTPAAEAPFAVNQMSNIVTVEVDLAGATTAEEVSVRLRGQLLAQTASGGPAGAGNLGNLPVTIGRASAAFPWMGLIHRALIINRKLTTGERAAAEAWAKRGMVYGAVLGDSTVAYLNPTVSLPIAHRVSAMVPGLITGGADLALSGDRVSHQKAKWQALTGKGALQVVFIQIGQNDVKGRVGSTSDPTTTADVIAELQDLVNTVRADVPAGCRIYLSALTPSKAWLDAAPEGPAAYAAWLAVNQAIAGAGPTPITGVDARISAHVAALDNGSGYLRPEFDFANDGVHEDNKARFIIAQAWRAQLEQDELV